MTFLSMVRGLCAGIALTSIAIGRVTAQTPTTGSQFWPELGLFTQLWPKVQFGVIGAAKRGEDYPYEQWRIGAGATYQVKSFTRLHVVDANPNNEHKLALGAGYEYIKQSDPSKPGAEDRVTLGVTPQARPPGGFFIADRNRFEFRWVDGVYSTRYRNKLSVERSTQLDSVTFAPYLSAEVFYNWAEASWNQVQYTIGISWPYKRLLKLNTYYLYQVCTTCSPKYLNVLGVTLNYFYRNTK